MLSFDITDRHVRIVKGTESGGRIRVSSATTLDLDDGLIVNGHIKDIPKMATFINDELKAKKMDDKEAVVTISSNLVIFKELHIPKAKTSSQLLTMVTNQMQHIMGIAEDYSISYSIAGEVEEEGVQTLKILATACPFEVVDGFRKVFAMLSIGLKSVVVSCNAMSRLILSDKKASAKMPMLVVQVDPNFVSLNFYEDGQLAFARFASIDKVDYDNSEDYMFEATNENIARMLQFQRSRNSDNLIQNVIFYGDTADYIRLTNALESQEISTSLMEVPNNIAGYENIEFQAYANAIGAMFKSNKDERVNLLETDATAGKTEAGASFAVAAIAAAVISAVVVAAAWVGFNVAINANENSIADMDAEIEAMQDTLDEVDATQTQIGKVGTFKSGVTQAKRNYDTWTPLDSEVFDDVDTILEENDCAWSEVTLSEGIVTFVCNTNGADEGAENIPNEVIRQFSALDKYDNITYNGFEFTGQDFSVGAAKGEDYYTFEFSFTLRDTELDDEETVDETAEEEVAE